MDLAKQKIWSAVTKPISVATAPITQADFDWANDQKVGFAHRLGRKVVVGARAGIVNFPIDVTITVVAGFWVAHLGYTVWDYAPYYYNYSARIFKGIDLDFMDPDWYTVIGAPILEETLCRGMIQPIVKWSASRVLGGIEDEEKRKQASQWTAIAVTALYFGGMHGWTDQAIGATWFGFVTGYISEKTQGEDSKSWGKAFLSRVAATTALHMMHNGICVFALDRIANLLEPVLEGI